MVINYLLTAWRNIIRNKAFSFINVMGLALGLTCSLLIIFWVHDEKTLRFIRMESSYTRCTNVIIMMGKLTQLIEHKVVLLAELKRVVPNKICQRF